MTCIIHNPSCIDDIPQNKAYPFIVECFFKLEGEKNMRREMFTISERYYFVENQQLHPEIERWISEDYKKPCKLDSFTRPNAPNIALKRTHDVLGNPPIHARSW